MLLSWLLRNSNNKTRVLALDGCVTEEMMRAETKGKTSRVVTRNKETSHGTMKFTMATQRNCNRRQLHGPGDGAGGIPRTKGILHVMLYNHHVTTDARRIDHAERAPFIFFPLPDSLMMGFSTSQRSFG